MTYFTPDRDARHPATALVARDKPTPTEEQLRQERSFKLESQRHEVQELALELEIARLKAQLKPEKHEPLTPREARVAWLSAQIEEAREKCHTIDQTVAEERAINAAIEAKPYDTELKARMKEAIGIHFESMRTKLGLPDVFPSDSRS